MFKWGGEVNIVGAPVLSNENFNGSYRFSRDEAPFVPDRYTAALNIQFGRLQSPDPNSTTLLRDMNMYALFANDMWRIRPSLTLHAGVRYDLRTLQGDLGGADAFEQPGFSRDRPEDVWLNVALGPAGALGIRAWRPIPNDTLDLSPARGFAGMCWDEKGGRSWQLRYLPRSHFERQPARRVARTTAEHSRRELANPPSFRRFPYSDLPSAITTTTVPAPRADTPFTHQSTVGFELCRFTHASRSLRTSCIMPA